MTFPSAPARWLGILAFCFLSGVGAQPLPSDPGLETFTEMPGRPAASPRRFEQAWDVVELMGQPMSTTDGQRPARVVLRPQGGLMVDGGCNHFSGRVERDAKGLFRVSKYGGTHAGCEKPPRSEALLNSALMMVDSYRWDRGLVLLSGGNELLRLQPSASQTSQDIEQALASRAIPTQTQTQTVQRAQPLRQAQLALPAQPARALASGAAEKNCRPVKLAKSGKAAAKGSKAARAAKAAKTKAGKMVCKPVAGVGKHKALKSAAKTRLTGKSKAANAAKAKAASKAKAKAKAKTAAKARAAARNGDRKRQP